MKKIDWIIIIILIGCVLFFVSYYFINQVSECSKNPLIYSAQYYEDRYKDSQVFGKIYIFTASMPITYFFNSSNVWVEP